MLSGNNNSARIFIYKIQFLLMKTVVKKSMLFTLGRKINISIVKLIVIRNELICNKYFINVTNNS